MKFQNVSHVQSQLWREVCGWLRPPSVIVRKEEDQAQLFFLTEQQEGLPENALVNVVVSTVIYLLYSFFWRTVWNYGNLFPGEGCRISYRQLLRRTYNIAQILRGPTDVYKAQAMCRENDNQDKEATTKAIFSWIGATYCLTDEDIERKAGKDATAYLNFQVRLIQFLFIVFHVCVGLVMSVNFMGDEAAEESVLIQGGIVNLPPDSIYLWVHVLTAFSFFVVLSIIMNRYAWDENSDLKYESNTLIIRGIGRRHYRKLKKRFEHNFPGLQIQNIVFVPSLAELMRLQKKWETFMHAAIWCENYERECGKRVMLNFPLTPNGDPLLAVEGTSYYIRQANDVHSIMRLKYIEVQQMPDNIAFLTYKTNPGEHRPPVSHISRVLNKGDVNWTVKLAPLSDDIIWRHLTISRVQHFIRSILVNLIVFCFLMYSTPTSIISAINGIHEHLVGWTTENIFLTDILPSIALSLLLAVLPHIVTASDYFIFHDSRHGCCFLRSD